MLKHHPKLKKEWFLSYSVLSKIAGKFMLTEDFEKELIRIIKKDVKETISKKGLFFPLGHD